jgi:hypothetical protein
MVTLEEAFTSARARFLGIPGIVGVSIRANSLVVYVERPEDVGKVGYSYLGWPIVYEVTGPIRLL